MILKKLLQVAADIIFPRHCLNCAMLLERPGPIDLCPGCSARLLFIGAPHCPVCGLMYCKSAGDSHPCTLCGLEKYAFDRARAVFAYNKVVAKMIHSLKFSGKRTGLRTMAALAEHSLLKQLSCPDIIIPVPLHPRKLRSRGFNQSQLLASVLFADQGHKIRSALIRIRPTRPQLGLRGVERRQNVAGAFAVPEPEMIRGRSVCLVDDVFTTGTTVNECAKSLKKAGAARVEVATLARVVDL